MLRITGSIEHRTQYDRIPMHDGVGKVSAYVTASRTDYRPAGASRRVRAELIAAALGGEVLYDGAAHGIVARVPHQQPATAGRKRKDDA
jgi:hypothetical protein